MAGDRKMHVVMFPWLAFGHMIKFIARKGHKVSFLSTPRNILRFPNLPPDLAIDFISLSLPHVDQLLNHAEATSDLCSSDIQFLEKAFDGLEPELTRFLQNSSPDWIIYDFVPHWLPPIAGKLGISHALLLVFSAWFAGFFGPASKLALQRRRQRN